MQCGNKKKRANWCQSIIHHNNDDNKIKFNQVIQHNLNDWVEFRTVS